MSKFQNRLRIDPAARMGRRKTDPTPAVVEDAVWARLILVIFIGALFGYFVL